MHQSDELEQLHEDIQIMEARNKEERDAKKAQNIQKGKEMAKVTGKRPAPSGVTSTEIPATKKVLGKEPYVVSIHQLNSTRCLYQPHVRGGFGSGPGSGSGGASGTTCARSNVR